MAITDVGTLTVTWMSPRSSTIIMLRLPITKRRRDGWHFGFSVLSGLFGYRSVRLARPVPAEIGTFLTDASKLIAVRRHAIA
jgi:hypothetical protein